MKLFTFLSLLIASLGTATACPDCALQGTGGQIEPLTLASKTAFSSSTLFMIGVVCAVVGFMFWMMVRTCREISRDRDDSSPIGA